MSIKPKVTKDNTKPPKPAKTNVKDAKAIIQRIRNGMPF